MCSNETFLCQELIDEYFGDIVAKVAYYLCCNSWQPLRFITAETSLKANQVRKALCVLIQHKFVEYRIHKNLVHYKADIKCILNLIYYPKIIYTAKLLYGDEAELVVEEILQHGIVLMSVVIGRVVKKLQGAENNDKLVDQVQCAFKVLVQSHFLRREGMLQIEDEEDVEQKLIPSLAIEESDLFQIPEVTRSALQRQTSNDQDDEPPVKRLKTSDAAHTALEDNGIYWSVNILRFKQYFRDQSIVTAVTKKHGAACGEIIRAMLRISEVTTSADAAKTQVVSAAEIFRSLPHGYSIKVEHINQHLNQLMNSDDKIVQLHDESGSGGSYIVNLKNAASAITTASILSYILERYGRKSCRIFRLLLMKKHLEQKQVEDFAMIPSKEVKECLYQMFTDNMLVMQEIPRTPDHAPSRTFYLFSVNISRVARMLLLHSFKCITNLIIRQKHTTKTHKRLLEKQERITAITQTLGDADEAQLEEIEQIMTSSERAQMTKYEHCINKLHSAQMQVSETAFTFDSYLKYVLIPP